MKIYKQLLILLTLALLLGACSSGKKAFKKGNYDKAVYQAVNKLRSNDDHKKASQTLERAYKYAVQSHLESIEISKKRNDLFMWENIASNYVSINNMYDEILRCPACRDIVPNPKRYDSELSNANLQAASRRYEMGMDALKFKRDRAKAMEAHQHFLRAQEFVPRYKDVEGKLKEALYYATLKVVVEPIPSPFRALDIKHEFFVNKIYEYLHHNNISPYVRFYSPDQAQAEQVEFVDHVIRMQFDGFSLGNVNNTKTIREVKRDSVLLTGKNEPQVYGTVKATITEFEKSVTGGGLLDFKIIDNDLNKVISQEKFPSEYVWIARWATFKGDERALNKEQLEMCELSDVPIPNPQWMFEEFTAPLYDQVISKLRAYYRNY